ncbi:MAG: hypothetical protein WC180_00415 [Candidatus Paceibacterota bacterium]|jgi:hypothetical protein
MENLFSKELLSADDLIKVSWKAFWQRFLKFAYVRMLAIVSFLFASTVLVASALASFGGGIMLTAILLDIVVFLIIVLVENIMFYEIIKDKNIRIRKAFRKALPKIKPVIGCWSVYFLTSLNLVVLLMFLGGFFLMSVALIRILPAAHTMNVVFGMMSAFLILFVGVILMILSIFAGIWQRFLFFNVIIEGMPVREALDHSFSLLSKNKQFVFERAGGFFLLYILIQTTLVVLSYIHPVFDTVRGVANYVLAGWWIVFHYSMYENIKAAGAEKKVDEVDRQAVASLLKSGWVILLTGIMVTIFSCVFLVAQSDFWSVAALASSLFRL